MNLQLTKGLFLLAGLYDAVLAIIFLLYPAEIFAFYEVTPPNHWAYIQFPALLLIVFAIMFFRISTDPVKHRELILYGCGLKAAYAGTAFWHDFNQGISSMWIPWAWMDLAFLIVFILIWLSLGRQARTA